MIRPDKALLFPLAAILGGAIALGATNFDDPAGHHGLARGSVVPSLPLDHESVIVRGLVYYYSNGVFYLSTMSGYVIASPIAGTAIRNLPDEQETFQHQGQRHAYAHGVFYREAPLDTFVVVEPPLGARIANLPAGAIAEYAGDDLLFEYRGVFFQPCKTRRGIRFEVVEAPGPTAPGGTGDDASAGRMGIEGRFMDGSTVFTLTGVDYGPAVLVERVIPGSPADEAGLRGGSLRVQFGEETLLLGGDLVLGLEFPDRCHGECLVDAPRLLASRQGRDVGVIYVRNGGIQRTFLRYPDGLPEP